MSEGKLLKARQASEREADDEEYNPIITVYEAERVDQVKIETKLRDIYAPIQYPMCGNYQIPNLGPIKDRKEEIGKRFAQEAMKVQSLQNSGFDGIYGISSQTDANNSNIIRQKIRMVRDLREEFYEENGEFIIQKDLFSEELSKLANISFENNDCLQYFQKNAILSERNNQKKQTPFTMQLYIGGLWFNQHPLNNEEEKEFQKIRCLLKDWAQASIHPSLPQMAKQLRYLERLREDSQDAQEIDKKIDLVTKRYTDQKLHLETLLKEIVNKNAQLRDIRKKTGMETVPWRIQVKQFEIDGKKSYDIGVTPYDVSDKVVAINPADVQAEEKRREAIREEIYFIKIYANNEYIGKSQKFKLQWPSFRVPLNQKFTIMVYTAPATLKVEVIKSGFINQVIDTIYLAIPGINAKSLTSSEKRYAATSFALNGKDYRRKMKDDKEKEDNLMESPSGILLHRIEWKGQGSKMPLLAPKTAEEETQCTEETEVDEESLLEELFDAKDPRIPHKAVRQKVQAGIKKQGNALLPFVDVQSARHLLLKMKNMIPQLQKLQIPLLEEEIQNRQDLQQIIKNEDEKRIHAFEAGAQDFYNPLEGIFSKQPEIVLKDIREIMAKIKILKAISSGTGGANVRFKITEEVISQFVFEQEQSPLAICCKNLFTQTRKLGPQIAQKNQTKIKIDELEINLHVRSAKNMPIREASYERIKNYQDQENKFKMQQMAQMATNFFDRLGGFFQGYRQQPTVSMHGHTYFNAFQNQGARNQEVNYNQHLQLDRANTFMMLQFKKKTKSTRCFEGPFPEWNQTMHFKYSMKNQQTNPEKILMHAEQSIKVYAFDEIQQSKPTQAISEARFKKTRFYLGRLEIPFSFIFTIPTVSGMFKLDRPLIQFGYGVKRSGLFDADIDSPEEMAKTQNPDIHTYLNLDLFAQPLIDNMLAFNADRKALPGGDNSQILQAAIDWIQGLNTKRYIRMWLNDIEGKSIFICRYLSDNISPPKLTGEGGSGSLIERAARYVSLIPRKYSCKLLEGTEEFHMRCDEFLNLKMGEDHGILLCNYFNFIDKAEGRNDIQSLLMICKAFPYGKSIFVLRRHKLSKHAEIWDPYRGESYYCPAKEYDTFLCCIRYEKQVENFDRSKDPCPILEVNCLVSKDNVYFNLQDAIRPPGIDFDIEDDKLWKPFLDERSRALFQKKTFQTIQPSINYEFYPEIPKQQSELEAEIFQDIRKHMEEQRKKKKYRSYTFKLNSRVSNMINKQLLQLCEQFKVDYRIIGTESLLYNDRAKRDYEEAVGRLQEERDRIKNQMPPDKNLYGFTLNMTYTTPSAILEKVTETQIYSDENEDIEFVLGVKCFEYPGHLISVWIFIGTIL